MSTAVREVLTESERRKFTDLETIVEHGLQTFVEVGAALAMIREQRLYRADHDTFEAYCEERWGWTSARARQLIASADTALQIESVTGVTVSEPVARELAPVPEEQRAEALAVAQEIATDAGHDEPTREDAREARKKYVPVKERKPRKPKAEPGPSKTLAEQVVEAAERHRAEAERTPEPKPVPNEPPVVVDNEVIADGPVVAFLRTLDPTALPEPEDIEGFTDEDLTAVRVLSAWCARVIGAYNRRRA